jgi:hypothetical protein
VAQGVQAVAGVVVVMFVARCFRRDPGRLAAAALLVGTFLATPHAFIYDMPMVMAAVALFIEDRLATSRVFDLGEVVVLAWVVMFPVLMVAAGVAVPLSVLPLALFFGLIVRRQGMVAA